MITDEQLEQLKGFDGTAPVLSLYLSVPPGLQPERAYITTFRARAQEFQEQLAVPLQEQFAAEAGAIEAWLESEPPQGQGVVAFSCQPAGLWLAAFIPFAAEDHLAYEALPHITPLLDMLEEHGRYGIGIVDREQARLLTVHLGAIEEDRRFRDDVDVPDEHVGWDEGKYERQYADHVHKHYKQ